MIMKDIDFEDNIQCKLYRDVKDIIKPSISKKNISSYKIVFRDDLLPVRVFYPKKVSNLEELIIYVPGDPNLTKCRSKYSRICNELAIELDKMIIVIDYYNIENVYPNSLNSIEKVIKYLYEQLELNGIFHDKIILMGDSSGGNFISSITFRFINNHLNYITKEILLYPILSDDYSKDSKFKSILNISENNLLNNIRNYMNNYIKDRKSIILKDVYPLLNQDYSLYPKTLIITGNLDPLRDEGEDFYNKLSNDSVYLNINYATHGFIGTDDIDIKRTFINKIKEFI